MREGGGARLIPDTLEVPTQHLYSFLIQTSGLRIWASDDKHLLNVLQFHVYSKYRIYAFYSFLQFGHFKEGVADYCVVDITASELLKSNFCSARRCTIPHFHFSALSKQLFSPQGSLMPLLL